MTGNTTQSSPGASASSWHPTIQGKGHPPPPPLGLTGRPGVLRAWAAGGARAPAAAAGSAPLGEGREGGRAAWRGTKGTPRSHHLLLAGCSECSPCVLRGRPEASDSRLGEEKEDGEATGSSEQSRGAGRPPRQSPPLEAGLVRIPPAPGKFWSCWGKGVASRVRGEPINCKEPLLSVPASQWAWPPRGQDCDHVRGRTDGTQVTTLCPRPPSFQLTRPTWTWGALVLNRLAPFWHPASQRDPHMWEGPHVKPQPARVPGHPKCSAAGEPGLVPWACSRF